MALCRRGPLRWGAPELRLSGDDVDFIQLLDDYENHGSNLVATPWIVEKFWEIL